jgi:hypothetical protein
MEQRQRNANGTFQKGQPSPEGARRKKGVLNKITADIKAGCISGFARHGSNGRGEGGFAGFCFYLAKKHPKAAARIVEKLLPLNVNGSGFPGAMINSVRILSVPSGTHLSKEELQRLQEPHVIDHEPERPELLEAPGPAPIELAQEIEAPSSEEAQMISELSTSIADLARRVEVSLDDK